MTEVLLPLLPPRRITLPSDLVHFVAEREVAVGGGGNDECDRLGCRDVVPTQRRQRHRERVRIDTRDREAVKRSRSMPAWHRGIARGAAGAQRTEQLVQGRILE